MDYTRCHHRNYVGDFASTVLRPKCKIQIIKIVNNILGVIKVKKTTEANITDIMYISPKQQTICLLKVLKLIFFQMIGSLYQVEKIYASTLANGITKYFYIFIIFLNLNFRYLLK